MIGTTLAASLMLPVIAVAEVFGDATGCGWLAGEAPTTDNLYLYDQSTIQRIESTCPVTGATPVGSGATVVTVACSGEGETWEDYYMIKTTNDVNTLIIHPEDYPEFATEISVCVPE